MTCAVYINAVVCWILSYYKEGYAKESNIRKFPIFDGLVFLHLSNIPLDEKKLLF
jgi:hypothetical protein